MRLALALIFGVILGFMIGGIQPRRDVAARDDTIRALQKKLVEAEKKGGRGRGSFPLALPGMDEVMASSPKAEHDGEHGDAPERGDGAVVVTMNGEPVGGPDGAGSAVETPEDARRAFNTAVDAQRVRAQQSRQALREQADLTDEDLAEFDGIVADMNASLADYGDEVMAWAEEEPETRDALGVAHEVTGILYDAQTAMEELVGKDGMGSVDETSGQIWNYIDLETFRPAVEAQISTMGSGGPRGR